MVYDKRQRSFEGCKEYPRNYVFDIMMCVCDLSFSQYNTCIITYFIVSGSLTHTYVHISILMLHCTNTLIYTINILIKLLINMQIDKLINRLMNVRNY